MTTVAEIDRLVRSDDAVAARLWPKLGPKVRDAYLHDRDSWIAVRRDVDAGKQPTAEAIEAHRKAFAGWARAFHAASKPRVRSHPPPPAATAPVVVVPKSTTPANPEPASPEARAMPGVASVKRAGVGAGGAVAGGLVLAGLIAVAARRKRA